MSLKIDGREIPESEFKPIGPPTETGVYFAKRTTCVNPKITAVKATVRQVAGQELPVTTVEMLGVSGYFMGPEFEWFELPHKITDAVS